MTFWMRNDEELYRLDSVQHTEANEENFFLVQGCYLDEVSSDGGNGHMSNHLLNWARSLGNWKPSSAFIHWTAPGYL